MDTKFLLTLESYVNLIKRSGTGVL